MYMQIVVPVCAIIIGGVEIVNRLIEICRISLRIQRLEAHWLELYAKEQNEKEQQEKNAGQKKDG